MAVVKVIRIIIIATIMFASCGFAVAGPTREPELIFETKKSQNQQGFIAVRGSNIARLSGITFKRLLYDFNSNSGYCEGPRSTAFFLEFHSGGTVVRIWKRYPRWQLLDTVVAPAQVLNLVYDRKRQRVLGFPGKRVSEWWMKKGKVQSKLFWDGGREPAAYGQFLPETNTVFYGEELHKFPDEQAPLEFTVHHLSDGKGLAKTVNTLAALEAVFPSRTGKYFYLLEVGDKASILTTRRPDAERIGKERYLPPALNIFTFEIESKTVAYITEKGQLLEIREKSPGHTLCRRLRRHDRLGRITFAASSSSGKTICLSDGLSWCLYSHGRFGLKLIKRGKAPTGVVLKSCLAVFD